MKGEPKRQAPECSVLHKLFSPFFTSLPAAPPPLFCSFSFYPFLHAAVFQSVCSGCLGQGAGGEEAKDLACSFFTSFTLQGLLKVYLLFFSTA